MYRRTRKGGRHASFVSYPILSPSQKIRSSRRHAYRSLRLPEGRVSRRPRQLPFHYESTGKITQFTNRLDPEPRSRVVFTFHRPEELLRLVGLGRQLRAALREAPSPNTEGLWPTQITAINNLESSLADNRLRALIQMATGSGKTLTAIAGIYRLLKFADARRVLFLVDRANLGRQAFREFQQYISPYTRMSFTQEYNVQHLRSNNLDPVSRVCITTIQRLYSMLKGEREFDEGNEEQSMYETAAALLRESVPVAYNPNIPMFSPRAMTSARRSPTKPRARSRKTCCKSSVLRTTRVSL